MSMFSGILAEALDTPRIVAIGVLCFICVVVLAIAIALFVISDKKLKAAEKVTEQNAGQADKPAPEEDNAPADEQAELEVAAAVDNDETAGETAEESEEESAVPPAETVKKGPAPRAAAADDDDEEEEVTEAPMDVDAAGKDMPSYMAEFMAQLSEPSKELLNYYAVQHRFSRMRDAWSYKNEKEFADDFFRNSIRFKVVMNDEIYRLMYDTIKKNKRGEALSKLRLKYANAQFRYAKNKPELIDECVEVLRSDVKYHLDVLDERNKKVASVKKLAVVYTYAGRYEEALSLCKKAIKRGLHDVGSRGFEPRRDRLKDLLSAPDED